MKKITPYGTHSKENHPLYVWLKKNKMSYRVCAEKLGRHLNTVYLICRGIRHPSLELAFKVEDLTCGEVQAIDIVAPSHRTGEG